VLRLRGGWHSVYRRLFPGEAFLRMVRAKTTNVFLLYAQKDVVRAIFPFAARVMVSTSVAFSESHHVLSVLLRHLAWNTLRVTACDSQSFRKRLTH